MRQISNKYQTSRSISFQNESFNEKNVGRFFPPKMDNNHDEAVLTRNPA
jgi:hypothetical protein